MDSGRWDRVKAGNATVYIMKMEPGRWEVTPEEEVDCCLGEVSDGDAEQWWSGWAGAAEDLLSHLTAALWCLQGRDGQQSSMRPSAASKITGSNVLLLPCCSVGA